MSEETLHLFGEELEMSHPKKAEKPKKPRENCLQEMLIELMNERGLKDADVVKGTSIPWPTWHGWISGDVDTVLTNENLKKVMRFFNVHLEYLVYGIGDDTPAFDDAKDDAS